MISRIFIDRPIFAWVLAIIVMLAGVGAILSLPIAQYPDVAPPQVSIRATFPGANAQTLQNSVTQVIEQQLTGIDGLLYFSSSSSSRGSVSITATFEKGTDPDIAQVQVQNQVQQGVARLPQQVQQQGLVVRKSNPDNLLIVGVYDETDQKTNQDVSDYLVSNLQDPLGRVQGVGDVNVFGSQYAMRIWLNPARLASYQLIPSDITTAIQNQNTEVAAGEVGGVPSSPEQMLNATVTAQSRLQTPEQFRQIIVKTLPSGATVRLSDVARIELGAESYAAFSRINRHPGAGIAVLLAPGADALKTAELVKAEVARVAKSFPPGLKVAYANDTTAFIKLSIDEVVKTLLEAIVLVVIVMFVFLQSWRATLVPAIAVPVVLLGTFAIFHFAGFSINTMTLFGLVLAIGLLVDDAIVVVENVERLMEEDPEMTPRQATIESMNEISVALIAIALVLSAVFLPMAFFGGSTGVIYRQFSLTIVSAMVLSVLVALILSPALTASLLKQKSQEQTESKGIKKHFGKVAEWGEAAGNWFNRTFEKTVTRYTSAVQTVVDRKWLFLLIYVGVVALLAILFLRLPTGFLPTEDQGAAIVQFRLPPGATIARTQQVQRQVENYFAQYEPKNTSVLFTVAGGGGGGVSGQNTGQGFLNFVDWKDRSGKENTADAITQRASGAFRGLRDAQVFALVPPAIRGLGSSDGFTMELQNTGGLTQEQFGAARDKLLAMANADPKLASVRLTELPDIATLRIDMDQQKLAALGLTQSAANNTLTTAWGGQYVNDFIDRGRVKRVYVQGDAPYRAAPDDLKQWFVRGSNGQMVPFSSFATTGWSTAPTTLSRFNGISSFEFSGSGAPGVSSGDAMARISELAAQIPGTSIAWSGLSYQERLSSGQAPLLYGLSILVVFLCLAALYESWSIPFAVLLIIPLGLIGAIAFVTLRGLTNDVYLQIGLLTTMGLAAKNAILMIEFAEQAERKGARVIDAALEAAKIRLRPILMTSFAFIFGVLPLAISTGAGANSRIAIGTAVIGGMLSATFLAIFYIPLFFVLVRRGVRDGLAKLRGRPTGHQGHHDDTPPAPPMPPAADPEPAR
ncbi:hydrophobe/amphiphile efflux-1 family RND transporter [Arthrobacter sp. TPD3018]|uniref:efflux RND transporter permease subunit n=1 Tax=Bacteria TaxID=2 RepID=UPI000D51C8A1|nr:MULTISPECIES: efflux RND transporter permease subunit [Bacteria]PVE55925.1 hydrophobe/amphiphile efflux-1 family RND transporter [Sphingomonas sp. TPD3009]PVE57669.1 hydrophobe/amphiphile efflux-1 family RND transporter [Arthrobacter sp. TPD3018]PVE83291.1 hydrophobe/amphiphile efflux-1 family RND transporter [Sphingomonas melonis]